MTTSTATPSPASTWWRVPRTRGAMSGVILVLLGLWGGLVPFIGPYFHYSYLPDTVWTFTWTRFWLEIVPAAAVLIGGLMLLVTANRASGLFGGWLASLGGVWFVVGPSLSLLWNGGQSTSLTPSGTAPLTRSVQEIGFFYGVGAVSLLFAAMALGRFLVMGIREAALVLDEASSGGPADTTPTTTGPPTTAQGVPLHTEPESPPDKRIR
jgi:hypothetical protein